MPSGIRENHYRRCVGRGNVSNGNRHGDRYRLLSFNLYKASYSPSKEDIVNAVCDSNRNHNGDVASYDIVGCSSYRKACASHQLRNSRVLCSFVEPAERPRDSHIDVARDQIWWAGQRIRSVSLLRGLEG
jgi:hypothetical protein